MIERNQNILNFAKRPKLLVHAFMLTTAMASVSGCGGSGGGSAPTPPPPAPPPPTRTAEILAFTGTESTASGSPQYLYTAEDDIQGQSRISAAPASQNTLISTFKFSPDGQWVAYMGNPTTILVSELYVVSVNSGTPVRVSQAATASRSVSDFDWSPDSTRLIFSGNFSAPFPTYKAKETYVVDRDGQNLAKVNGTIGSPPSVETRNAQWSPDGARVLTEVANVSGGDAEGSTFAFGLNIYPDATPAGGYRLAAAAELNNARWAPTSDRVCYTADFGGGFKIYTSAMSVGSIDFTALSNTGHINGECRWSADGTDVAYLETTAPGGPSDLEVRAADASASATIVAALAAQGRTIRAFEWAPGSNSTLAYIAERDTENVYELYVARIGGPTTKINAPLSGSADVLDFAWSPDRTKLAYVADIDVDGQRQLYVGNADGSGRVKISDFLAGDEVVDFDWSADSSRLVFSAGPAARTPVADSLYVATANGVDSQMINTPIVTKIGSPVYAD